MQNAQLGIPGHEKRITADLRPRGQLLNGARSREICTFQLSNTQKPTMRAPHNSTHLLSKTGAWPNDQWETRTEGPGCTVPPRKYEAGTCEEHRQGRSKDEAIQ